MPSQAISSVENNFTKGLVTEFTGLNFPENAATDTDNCIYTLVGDVTRRLGIDKEVNGQFNSIGLNNVAINSYKWTNAGGDGSTQIVVIQAGSNLIFFLSSASTEALPLSRQFIDTTTISTFVVGGNTDFATRECQFSDGNGYLFVYHPNCDPFFITYSNGTISSNRINVQIRDFVGVEDNLQISDRPKILSNEHLYNLINQGWSQGSPWAATSTQSKTVQTGSLTFTDVQAGLSVTLGDVVLLTSSGFGTYPIPPGTQTLMNGTVTAYSGTTMTINVIGTLQAYVGSSYPSWNINPVNHGFINTWNSAVGNYPSNADVWWYFKDNSNTFNPATTANQVTLNTGPAPSGHFAMSAFDLNRSLASGVAGLTEVVTSIRPRTGTWFQGRVWYGGLDSSQIASGDVGFYTWTENLYFSQIVTDTSNFGQCYQTNDPTSETLFGLLPTDGGVITIQGSGAIYKLFPIANGMLVFAANGVWFITGSQGIGFTANDYTITKISAIQSISSTSFVDVQGLPYFWNEEGIYLVKPTQGGGLSVEPITVGTILQYYNNIPMASKRYVRGAYHPIDYIIQWTFRSTNDSDNINDRYSYDKILNYNTYNKAFFPYSITGAPQVNGVIYVSYPGGNNAPDPTFKYLTSLSGLLTNNFTFSEELDDRFVDWVTATGTAVNYDSYFVTGYKLHGQGQKKFQLPYIYVFSNNLVTNAYKIQGIWDYALNRDSGRWTNPQLILNVANNFGIRFRRHRIRGNGLVLQLKVSSVDGQPFDIMGWSTYENLNQGV